MPELDVRWDDPPRLPGASDDRGQLRALARLARRAATSGGADLVLGELVVAAGHVLPADGVGVMQTVRDRTSTGRLEMAHAEPRVEHLERLQETLQRGPCRDSVDRCDVVVVDDVGATRGRYGMFADRTLEAGLRSVVAVPLLSRGRTWGALDLYRREARGWSTSDVEAAVLLADVAVCYLALARDREAAWVAQQDIQHRSMHDPLTGLPNRALLYDRIEHAVAGAVRHGTGVGVGFLDLDRFKVVNDSLGHAAGDDVLVEVARRLRSAVRAGDTLARLAGDEFVVLWTDLPSDEARRRELLTALTVRLQQSLRRPVRAAGEPVLVTASIGVTTCAPRVAVGAERLVHEADLTMYLAKEDRDAVAIRDLT